jgi:hypothetical protein
VIIVGIEQLPTGRTPANRAGAKQIRGVDYAQTKLVGNLCGRASITLHTVEIDLATHGTACLFARQIHGSFKAIGDRHAELRDLQKVKDRRTGEAQSSNSIFQPALK